MTIKEMKDILYKKLQDEETCFTIDDLIIKKTDYGYNISLFGYEPFFFKVEFVEEEWAKDTCILITEMYKDKFNDTVALVVGCDDTALKEALVDIGYFVGTRY